jgi:hypothetical protein
MKRFAVLLAPLLCLTACVSTPEPLSRVGTATTAVQCHVGPDGGAPVAERGSRGTFAERGIGGPIAERGSGETVAERGIGGTGGPATRRAERGIGGTGAPPHLSAERGIGGTGITGIVTGFASVCVDGLEVALGDQATVDIDGTPVNRSALRVGQVVAIKADPPEQAPVASRVSVRHEVSGPVEAVLSVNPGLIVVAGQRVRVPAKALGSLTVQPGVWVAVSGLRGPDGDIIASRLDPRAPGRVLVHGPLIVADGEASIGSLAIRSRRDTKADVGTYVTISGTWLDGTLTVETLAPDLLVSNPPAWFGAGTTRLVLESYGQFTSGSATITGGFQASLASGFVQPKDLSGPVVMSLEAQSDGSFAVIRASPAVPPASPAVTPGGAYRTPGAGDTHPSGAMDGQSTVSVMGPAGTRASGVAYEETTQPYGPVTRSYPQTAAPETVYQDGSMVTGSAPAKGGSGGGLGGVFVGGPRGGATGGAGGGIVYSQAIGIGAGRISGTFVNGGPGAIAPIGGIRLMGAGAAALGGHAGAGMLAPRVFGTHITPMRFRPGR